MGKGRAPCCDKTGLKKGPWTPLEDQKLISFIQKHGHSNWRALPKQAGLLRCGKSCRLRWINYLRPDIKRGNFTRVEEETIIRLHESLGNKWSLIASHLPGRTDNEIKNVWNTHLKKKLSSKGTNPCKDNNPSESSISSSSFSSTSDSKISYSNSGLGIEQEEPKSPSEEAYRVLFDTQKKSLEDIAPVQPFINRAVQLSNWMVQSKSNPSLEEAREVSSPSYSTCSSYVSHPFKHVVEVEGVKAEEETPHQQLKSDKPFEVHDIAIEELLEIPCEPDILGMLDNNVDPLSGMETHYQQTVLSGNQEPRKEGESRNSWLAYLEYELGLQEESTGDQYDQNQKNSTGNDGFVPQGSIDEMLMDTEMDPVSIYFQMLPSSPLDFSLLNKK